MMWYDDMWESIRTEHELMQYNGNTMQYSQEEYRSYGLLGGIGVQTFSVD